MAGNVGVSDGTAVSKPVVGEGVAVGVPVAGKVVAVRHRLAAYVAVGATPASGKVWIERA